MCGTTRVEDARAAISLGVDALGFIFVEKSPRFIEPDRAAGIIAQLPPFISSVGVFVDCEIDKLKAVVTATGLTRVQLHGGETPDYCRELKGWNRSLGICKTFLVGEESDFPDFSVYRDHIDSVLFDTRVKGMAGGTGRVFDWTLISSMTVGKPVVLAGGLKPDNVAEAVKVAAPYAIDINSGVEDRPGIKNHLLLKQLIERVRQIENQFPPSL